MLGADTQVVLSSWLGLSDERIGTLERDGAFGAARTKEVANASAAQRRRS
jgi:hypothetical protein